jgi:hypothetical protein
MRSRDDPSVSNNHPQIDSVQDEGKFSKPLTFLKFLLHLFQHVQLLNETAAQFLLCIHIQLPSSHPTVKIHDFHYSV